MPPATTPRATFQGDFHRLAARLRQSNTDPIANALSVAIADLEALQDPRFTGGIHIYPQAQAARPCLVIQSQGAGCGESTLHLLLAELNESARRAALPGGRGLPSRLARAILTGFALGEQVILQISNGREAFQWTGWVDGTYTMAPTEAQPAGIGLTLYNDLGPSDLFERARALRYLQRAARLLRWPLYLYGGADDAALQISMTPPWRLSRPDQARLNEARLRFGQRIFGVTPLDWFPIKVKVCGLEGLVYILPPEAMSQVSQRHHLYLRGRLRPASAEIADLFPPWARFCCCVADSEHDPFQITADGDRISDEVKVEGHEALWRFLEALKERDPQRLRRIVESHAPGLKRLALDQPEQLDGLMGWLPIETSEGAMTLASYRARYGRMYYTTTTEGFHRLAPIAACQGLALVKAAAPEDEPLLRRAAQKLGLSLHHLDGSRFKARFEPLAEGEEEPPGLRVAQAILEPLDCGVSLRCFVPTEVPALFAIEGGPRGPVRALYLNAHNPIIRRLLDSADVEDEWASAQLERGLRLIYLQTLLLSQRPLDPLARAALRIDLPASLLLNLPERPQGSGEVRGLLDEEPTRPLMMDPEPPPPSSPEAADAHPDTAAFEIDFATDPGVDSGELTTDPALDLEEESRPTNPGFAEGPITIPGVDPGPAPGLTTDPDLGEDTRTDPGLEVEEAGPIEEMDERAMTQVQVRPQRGKAAAPWQEEGWSMARALSSQREGAQLEAALSEGAARRASRPPARKGEERDPDAPRVRVTGPLPLSVNKPPRLPAGASKPPPLPPDVQPRGPKPPPLPPAGGASEFDERRRAVTPHGRD